MTNPIDLHALADGELDQKEAARLREAIRQDPAAQAEYSAILNLKDYVQQNAQRFDSEECWKVCTSRIGELDRARRVERVVGRFAPALCGLLLVVIVGARYMVHDVRGETARTADLGRVFGTASRQAQPVVPPEVSKTWLDLASRAIQLRPIGGAQGSFQGIPVTRVDLVDGTGRLELYVIHDNVNFEDTMPTGETGVSAGVLQTPNPNIRVNCLIWSNNGRTLVLAGPRSTEQLGNAASELSRRP